MLIVINIINKNNNRIHTPLVKPLFLFSSRDLAIMTCPHQRAAWFGEEKSSVSIFSEVGWKGRQQVHRSRDLTWPKNSIVSQIERGPYLRLGLGRFDGVRYGAHRLRQEVGRGVFVALHWKI